jgi:hypothetical protein
MQLDKFWCNSLIDRAAHDVGRCNHVPACLWRYNVLVYIIYGEGRRRTGRRSMDRVRRELASAG